MEQPVIKVFKPKDEFWRNLTPTAKIAIPAFTMANGLIQWLYIKRSDGKYEYNHKESVIRTAKNRLNIKKFIREQNALRNEENKN